MKAEGVTGELAEEAEVLTAGEGLIDELGLAARGGDGLVHEVDHVGVVELQGVALLEDDLDVAVEGDADTLADALHLRDGRLAAAVAEGAEHGDHLRLAGGDVHGVAAGQVPTVRTAVSIGSMRRATTVCRTVIR